jgi:hypothetical protein
MCHCTVYSSVAAMSCAQNRARRRRRSSSSTTGSPPQPLGLLLNHWVSNIAPDRSTAVVVNARDFVVRRARECAAQRGRMPAFIAVDFSDIGDVMGAVNALNHVGG